jgi:hypothetical protein
MRCTDGDLKDKICPGRRLDKVRARLYAKELVLLQGMERHIKFIFWEPTFGGKFPQASYDRLINHTQKLAASPLVDSTANLN